MTTRTFQIAQDGTITEEEWTGDERNSVTAEPGEHEGLWKLSCDTYYTPGGRFEMVITQPIERALRTFQLALLADYQLEVGELKPAVIEPAWEPAPGERVRRSTNEKGGAAAMFVGWATGDRVVIENQWGTIETWLRSELRKA